MANMRPYDVAISDAIEKNDARRLEKYIQQAKDLHAQQGGDLSKAIRKGEAALKKLQKGAGSKAKGKK